MLTFWLRRAAIWFGAICLLVFIFSKPAQFGDLVGKGVDGIGQAVSAVVTVLDQVSR